MRGFNYETPLNQDVQQSTIQISKENKGKAKWMKNGFKKIKDMTDKFQVNGQQKGENNSKVENLINLIIKQQNFKKESQMNDQQRKNQDKIITKKGKLNEENQKNLQQRKSTKMRTSFNLIKRRENLEEENQVNQSRKRENLNEDNQIIERNNLKQDAAVIQTRKMKVPPEQKAQQTSLGKVQCSLDANVINPQTNQVSLKKESESCLKLQASDEISTIQKGNY